MEKISEENQRQRDERAKAENKAKQAAKVAATNAWGAKWR